LQVSIERLGTGLLLNDVDDGEDEKFTT
jgi:hypothetical protein